MKRARFSDMKSWRLLAGRAFLLTGLMGLMTLPTLAGEKPGMPDLCQDDQTCLPTSTGNLIVWFGLHGYPKLIVPGDSRDNGYIHTIHKIMAATDARFDWGTRPDMVTVGIKKYIQDAGYDCDVEFRGLGKTAFDPSWLKENDDSDKGFVLLLGYVSYNENNNTFSNAFNAGHAVTLVDVQSDSTILIHDPAHMEDETGRKIITTQVLRSGTFDGGREGNPPVAGLMLLSGSILEAPPDSQVMLMGAVCVTMRDAKPANGATADGQAKGPGSIGANGTPSPATPSSPTTPAKQAPASTSWMLWLFDLIFKK